jgi:hypothetical protein
MITDFTEAYFQFVSAWRQTLLASLLSIVMLLAYFLTFYSSARAFGLAVPLRVPAFMPAVDIISALPTSLGGFGVREHCLRRCWMTFGSSPRKRFHFRWEVHRYRFCGACSVWPCCRLATGALEARQGMSWTLRGWASRYRRWPNLLLFHWKDRSGSRLSAVAAILRDSQFLAGSWLRHGTAGLIPPSARPIRAVLAYAMSERSRSHSRCLSERAKGFTRRRFELPAHSGDVVMPDVLHYFSDHDQRLRLRRSQPVLRLAASR